MNHEADIVTMKKCVKAAGFEEEMSTDQLKEVFNVLQTSMCQEQASTSNNQNHSDSEEEDIVKALEDTLNQNKDSTFTYDSQDIFKTDSLSDDSSTAKNTANRTNNNIISDWKAEIHFNDMPVSTSKNTLNIIYHELKYVSIQNSQQFISGSVLEKKQLLFNYHIAMAKLKSEYARQIGVKVTLPKASTPSYNADASAYSFSKEDETDGVENGESTYISRSGRLTKRKVYNDDEDDFVAEDSAVAIKKSKNNHSEWLSKNSQTSKTAKAKKPDALNNISITTESNGPHLETEDAKEQEPKEKRVRKLLPPSKPLSNEEIMAKSSLFKDYTNSPAKSRHDAIFDKLKKSQEEQRKLDRTMDLFDKTLQQLSDDDSETVNVIDEEPEFEKRRVVPPVPRRPIGANRKRVADALPIKTAAPSTPPTSTVSTSVKNMSPFQETNQSRGKQAKRGGRAPRGGGKGAKVEETVVCPICSKSFLSELIQEHAATCGEGDIIPQPANRLSRITCNICDKVVSHTEDYDTHVKECMRRHEIS